MIPSRSEFSEEVIIVMSEDTPVGLVRKFRDEPDFEFPWQAFAFDAVHPQTGEPCAGTMIGEFWGGEDARLDAVRCLLGTVDEITQED